MSESIYAKTFKEYDKDNSGLLDSKEMSVLLTNMFSKSGLKYDESSIQYYMEKFDTTKDGKIELAEFVTVMEKYNPTTGADK